MANLTMQEEFGNSGLQDLAIDSFKPASTEVTRRHVIRMEETKPGLWRIVERAVNANGNGLSPDWFTEIVGGLSRPEAMKRNQEIKHERI